MSTVTEPFDFRTELRDPKTSKVLVKQDYRMRCSKEEGQLIERPINSGHWYNAGGTLVRKPEHHKVEEKAPEVAPVVQKIEAKK